MAKKSREQAANPTLNLHGLRGILAEEIVRLRAGETTAANVNAVTNATGKIIATVKLEMEYYKMIGRTPNIPMLTEGSAVPDAPSDE